MATKAPKVAESTAQVPFTSLKDSAFQQAGAHQTLESVAHYVMGQVKTFPKEVPTETKDSLYEGYRMKFDVLKPAVMYAVIHGHYVLASEEHNAAKNVEKVEICIPYAYS